MRSLHRVLAVVAGLAVVGSPLAAVAPAQASPAAGAVAAAVPCLNDFSSALPALALARPKVPLWRQQSDTTPVTRADLDALPALETTPGVVARKVAPKLSGTLVVPTYVHVIKGTHKGETTPTGPKRVRTLLATLNNAMAGKQSSQSAGARYRFRLKKISYTKRDGWFHAYNNGPRDTRMKRALHRGNARTLNLYINGGGPRDATVLGWARFPWQYRSAPFRDGVSVTVAALRGGKATGYNLGDTVVHETGHWLGLFHTFQGGCSAKGDVVPDTAREGEPSYYCETSRDTCAAAGVDPVRNFLDYSLDACMNMFTAGQVRRMDAAFEKWRL